MSAIVWCGSNYRALKHQAATNKFKSDSLQTFRAFIKAAQEPDMKDAILMETTRSIFREYNPGYIKQAPSDGIKFVDIHNGISALSKRTK